MIDARRGRPYQSQVERDLNNRPDAHDGDRNFGLPTLVPELPIFGWLARLDTAKDSARPASEARLAVLDLSKTTLHGPGLRALVQEMQVRGVRVVGLTGLNPAQVGDQAAQLPPILPGSGVAGVSEPSPAAAEPASLVIEGNVRSGQQVLHPNGDVSVVGTVASGAEVRASGSVHVYGALRGRASAGEGGGPAQIFCHRLEAEVLTINGIVLAADDMESRFLGRPVRAVREGDAIRLRDLS